jgi:hypothetical protein
LCTQCKEKYFSLYITSTNFCCARTVVCFVVIPVNFKRVTDEQSKQSERRLFLTAAAFRARETIDEDSKAKDV